jgi:hypothetical protein
VEVRDDVAGLVDDEAGAEPLAHRGVDLDDAPPCPLVDVGDREVIARLRKQHAARLLRPLRRDLAHGRDGIRLASLERGAASERNAAADQAGCEHGRDLANRHALVLAAAPLRPC